MAKIFVCLIFAVFSSQLYAEKYEATWTKVPTLISGTLEPFVLAIDGVIISRKKKAKLLLGDAYIETKNESNQPFFTRVESDVLKLTIEESSKEILEIKLPTLNKVAVESSQIHFYLNDTEKIMVQGGAYPVQEGRAVIPRDEIKNLSELTLELVSKYSRTYILSLTEIEPLEDLSKDQRVTFSFGDNSGSDRFGWHLAYGIHWLNRVSFEARGSVVFRTQGSYEEVYALLVSTGYQLFRRGEGPRRGTWLEGGLWLSQTWITYKAEWVSPTDGQTYRHEYPMNGMQSGVYIRSEPIRIGFFGFSMKILYRLNDAIVQVWQAHTQLDRHRVRFTLEFSYHW